MGHNWADLDRGNFKTFWCSVRNPVYSAIAIGVGIVVLLGYFLQIDLLVNLRIVLLEWATILVAVALLVGIVNLFIVHFRKSAADQQNRINSIILLISLTITLLVAGWFGPTHPYSLWIFNYIQIPIEASLMAILAVVLIYAGVRLLRRKPNLLSIVFVATAVIILLMSGPLFGIDIPGLAELRIWIGKVPAVAGARGILIGVSLGIVAAGLRILIGADRPYGGS
jgi:membrane-associated HD superfamily phosphohydrolase